MPDLAHLLGHLQCWQRLLNYHALTWREFEVVNLYRRLFRLVFLETKNTKHGHHAGTVAHN